MPQKDICDPKARGIDLAHFYEVLKRISGHYKDPSRKLPDDFLRRMIAARDVGQMIFKTRQLVYALFDLTLHTQERIDPFLEPNKVFDDLYLKLVGVQAIPENHFPAALAT